MRIGFFLAYRPETELNNQGLGRYTAYLIKGLLNNGVEITIATPKWSKKTIEDLLEDVGVESEKINFLTSKNIPVLLNLYSLLKNTKFKKTRKNKRGLRQGLKKLLFKVAPYIVSTRNYLLFFIYTIIIFLLLVPIFAFKLIAKFIEFFSNLIFKSKTSRLSNTINRIEEKVKNLLNKNNLGNVKIARALYQVMYDAEVTKLIDRINTQNIVDVWYCPTVFWPEFNKIDGVKVTCVPDLIPIEYPVEFTSKEGILDSFMSCKKTIEKSEYTIVYDDYVKDNLLVKKFGKKSEHIAVIPHGANVLSQHISIEGTTDNRQATKVFSLNKIDSYKNIYFQGHSYLRNFDFSDVKYLFYPSQLRPNKNILSLIKAYEHVLRTEHRYVKLFLTCDLQSDSDVKRYIEKQRLQYDVISFVNVPTQTLAALYHCAELVINPTLFEGGFPFTFAEGASVGTPSIMSSIPQTEDFVKQFGLEGDMLFDPFDWREISKKIIWGLDHREELLEKQIPMYEHLEHRDWNVVATEYVKAFNNFIKDHKVVRHEQNRFA